MASNSKTDIINSALGHLKQRPIASIDPPVQTSAKIAVKYFDDAILVALRMLRPWWAKKTIQLSASSEIPLSSRFVAKFAFPDDFVALCTIGDMAIDQFTEEYDLQHDGLLLNQDGPILIEYIFQQLDVTRWDAVFKMCAGYALAELMAYEITGNANLRQMMADKVLEFEIKQRAITGQERPTKRFQQSKFAAARMRASSRGSF